MSLWLFGKDDLNELRGTKNEDQCPWFTITNGLVGLPTYVNHCKYSDPFSERLIKRSVKKAYATFNKSSKQEVYT